MDPRPEHDDAAVDDPLLDLAADPPKGISVAVVLAELIFFTLGFIAAFLVAAIGGLFGAMLRAQEMGVVIVMTVVFYLYMKHMARLRLEVRRLQALELLLREWKRHQREKPAPTGDEKKADAPLT